MQDLLARSSQSKIPSAPVAEEYNVIATPTRHYRLQSVILTTIQAFSCGPCSRPVDVRLCSTALAPGSLGPRKTLKELPRAVHRCRILPPDRLTRSTSHLNFACLGCWRPFSAFVFIMPIVLCSLFLRIRSWVSSFSNFDLSPMTALFICSSDTL